MNKFYLSRLPAMPYAVDPWQNEFAKAVMPQLEAFGITADLQNHFPNVS